MKTVKDGGDTEWIMAHISPTCAYCKNFDSRDWIERTCRAFPDGIPREIWLGKNTHTKPYKGDHGIRFEKLK